MTTDSPESNLPDQVEPAGDSSPAQQPQSVQSVQFFQAAPTLPPVIILQKPERSKKGFGVASMVLGISAVLFSWTVLFSGLLLITAFVFGIISLKRGETPRGFAITGISLGSIAVALILLIAAVIAMFAGALGLTVLG